MAPVHVRQIPNHNCELSCLTTTDNLISVIHSGLCVKFRRNLHKLLVVSDTYSTSRMFFKSTAHIHIEQIRHIKTHPYMIHPLSQFRIFWEGVMMTVFFLLLVIMIPLSLTYLKDTPPFITFPKFGLDMVCYVDVVFTFFTGYINTGDLSVELNPKKVAKRYILGKYFINGLFIPDILSSFPITLIMYATDREELYSWKIFFIFKLFRIPTMVRYFRNYLTRHKFWISSVKPLIIFTLFLVGVFWFMGISVYYQSVTIGKFDIVSSSSVIDTCTKIIQCIMLVGPDPMPYTGLVQEKILRIFCILVGSCINMIILAQILSIYKSRNTARNQHQELLQGIEQYATYRQISSDLKDKIMKYVDFKYHRKILREAELMDSMSGILREEVMFFNCQCLVERVDFFKILPPAVLQQIVNKLKPEVFLKNEVIYHVGSASTSMYFIYVGKVIIYSDIGKELKRLGEGKHFGEVSLLNNTPQMCTAVAATDCELLGLKKHDLAEVLKPYPKLCVQLAAFGLEKHKRLSAKMSRVSGMVKFDREELMRLL